jgi:hypothetical protein
VFIWPLPVCTTGRRIALRQPSWLKMQQPVLSSTLNCKQCSAINSGWCHSYVLSSTQARGQKQQMCKSCSVGAVQKMCCSCEMFLLQRADNARCGSCGSSESIIGTYLPSASHCLRRTRALRLDSMGGRYLFGPTCLNCSAASPSLRSKCDMMDVSMQQKAYAVIISPHSCQDG